MSSGWAPAVLLALGLAVLPTACGNAEPASTDAPNAASADSAVQPDSPLDAIEPVDVAPALASDAQAAPPLKVYAIPPQLVVSEYLALDVPRAQIGQA